VPREIVKYDLIIIDEIQDMTPLYFHLVGQIIHDIDNADVQVCVLGDKNQSIFDFNDSDSRFITRANDIFKYNSRSWEKLALPTSFRVTKGMALFINNCMLNTDRILSSKCEAIDKPQYMICDTFDKFKNTNKVYQLIEKLIKNGAKPDDFFILAASLRSTKTPVSILENLLKNNMPEIPIYVPSRDVSEIDDDVIKKKMLFSTFHQAKGLERKIVIVYGFEESYFKYYKKDCDPTICPNELYVACTRASEKLVLVHHKSDDYLPFLKENNLRKYCDVIGEIEKKQNKNVNLKPKLIATKPIGVCDLIRHLPVKVIDDCCKPFVIVKINEIEKKISIPCKSLQKNDLYEELSEITGVAIPMYFEYKRNSENCELNNIITWTMDETNNSPLYLDIKKNVVDTDIVKKNKQIIKEYDVESITIAQLLHIAIMHNFTRTSYIFKLDQIVNYDWISENNLKMGLNRLHELNITEGTFEKRVERQNIIEIGNTMMTLSGFIDYIDEDSVYEFKCVAELLNDHYIQLALYKYMYESAFPNEKKRRYYLYNILTNEKNELSCSLKSLDEMVKNIIKHKYEKKKNKDDETFFHEIDVINKLIQK
jgi:hypothetical protein